MNLFRRRSQAVIHGGLSQAQNDLGLRALSRLARHPNVDNVCLSPTGLTLSLSAAFLAASDETREELGRALGFDASPRRSDEERLRAWRRSLLDQEPLTILAASAWLPAGMALSPRYADSLSRTLEAEVSVLDEDEATAVGRINQWASRMSHGRIRHVLSSLDSSARLALLTAVDLRAKWEAAFHPDNTRPLPFHLAPGRTVLLPMMRRSGEMPHFRTADFEGIALGYTGGRRRMIILLPCGDRTLDDALTDLDDRSWKQIVRRLHVDTGTVILPRFQLQATLSLAGALIELGLGRAFDPGRAQFAGVSSSPGVMAIGQVSQATRLDVDEEGTQASAVTLMVQVVAWPPPRPTPFEIYVDRPFLFAIEDQRAQALLFVGAVRDPRPPKGRAIPESSSLAVPPGTPPDIRSLGSS